MPDPVPTPAPATPPHSALSQPTQDSVSPTLTGPPGPAAASAYPFLGPPDRPGDLGRLGGYRVTKLLGEGGMGFVFRAEDDGLQRSVALKVMRPEVAARPTSRDRFLREGRAVAAVKSDHVITIYQVGEENGVPFLAMEFLEGMSLDEWLKARPTPPDEKAVLKVARDVLKGLQAAHARGLIHRDIKPANLWVEKGTSRVKLLDFGLTHLTGDDAEHLTQSGAIMGTPAYMAPEQADGKKVDARTDLFSLGVVLYRMVAGQSPFQRDGTMATLMAVGTFSPPPPAGLSAGVAGVVMRLLSKAPAGRPESASAATEEFRKATEGRAGGPDSKAQPAPPPLPVIEPLPAPAPDPWEAIEADPTEPPTAKPEPKAPRKPPGKRRRVAAWLFGVLALVAGGFIVIKVTNKDGSVTELKVPGDATLEVRDSSGKTLAVIDPKAKEPKKGMPTAAEDKIDYAAERKAAEMLLRVHADFHLRDENDQAPDWSREQKRLPEGKFYVASVDIQYSDLSDIDLSAFTGCTRLEWLRLLSCSKLTDAGVSALAKCHRLRSLDFTYSGIGDAGLELAAANPDLEVIALGYTKATDAGQRLLAKCPRLREAHLNHTTTDETLALLAEHCCELRIVDLKHSVQATLKPLAKLPRLREVVCTGDHLTPEGVQTLAAIPYLNTLHVAPQSPAGLVERLKPLGDKLSVLRFSSFYDWDQGIPTDAWKPLAEFQGLRDLNIEGAKHVVDAAALNQFAGMRHLRRLQITPAPAGQKYTPADVAKIRLNRLDVELTIRVEDKVATYPRLDNWPGKGEGDGGIAAWDLPKDAPPPAVVPFSSDEAKKHQEAWAA